jgi:hypothetical protein
MTTWILIFWLGMGERAGGPAAVNGFETEQACHAAAVAIKNAQHEYSAAWRETHTGNFFREGRHIKPYVCVPNR